MERIDELAIKWSIAKQAEEKARDERVAVEQEILQLTPAREEGSQTITTQRGVKITTTGKLTYKCDITQLVALTKAWPAESIPVKTEVKADESILKALREHSPDAWRQIAPAITVMPAKTGVRVVFRDE